MLKAFSALVVLVPISAKGQPSPDSARFNQNTSVLKNFGLDSAADLENMEVSWANSGTTPRIKFLAYSFYALTNAKLLAAIQ